MIILYIFLSLWAFTISSGTIYLFITVSDPHISTAAIVAVCWFWPFVPLVWLYIHLWNWRLDKNYIDHNS